MTVLSLFQRLFVASRPISWVNTAYPFALTYYLLTGSVDLTLVVGTFFFLVPYNLVMYGVNDVFDYASDLTNPRKGGVEGALLPPESHRAVLLACGLCSLPFLLYLWWVSPLVAGLFLALLMLDVVGYSMPPLRTKERAFLDSLTSSIHFVGPAVYAVFLTGTPWSASLIFIMVSFLAWGMAAHAFGAVQDIVPDRAAGLSSIATVLGACTTVRLAISFWALSGLLLLLAGWPISLLAVLVTPYIAMAAPFIHITDDTSMKTNRGWRHFLWINYTVGFLLTLFIIAIHLIAD